MDNQIIYKKQAAESAVDFIENRMTIGLGTGSTVRYALEKIATLVKEGQLKNLLGIPSSRKTARLAHKLKIPLTDLQQHPVIDVTIDGADEVDAELNLIKGGGGALLREKVLAQASMRLIIVVDESKLSEQLGTGSPLPVEILPFAWRPEALFIESLGAKVNLRKNNKGNIFRTDQGNYILDCDFGPIDKPVMLAAQLNKRAGIIEHGLFLGLTSRIIVAGKQGVRHFQP